MSWNYTVQIKTLLEDEFKGITFVAHNPRSFYWSNLTLEIYVLTERVVVVVLFCLPVSHMPAPLILCEGTSTYKNKVVVFATTQ
jgi:hypothetical protein